MKYNVVDEYGGMVEQGVTLKRAKQTIRHDPVLRIVKEQLHDNTTKNLQKSQGEKSK